MLSGIPFGPGFCPLARAASPSEAQCIASYEAGQRSRRAGRLKDAQTSFVTCAQSSCPDIAQTDCSDWLREVNRSMPTISVIVAWSDGTRVVDGKLLLDGVPTALDGKLVAVDPGKHALVMQVGEHRIEETFVAVEGEKARVVSLTFRRPKEDKPSDTSSALTFAPWILSATSVAALGGFVGLAVSGTHDLETLRETCAPNCPEGSIDPIRGRLIAGDVLLGVSIVSAGVAVPLFVMGATASSSGSAVSIALAF